MKNLLREKREFKQKILKELRNCKSLRIDINFIMRGFTMPSGKVKWFNSKKGYGFITPDAGEKDLFLHATGFENQYTRAIDFTADMPCEFDVETTDRGPVAKNVTGPDGSNFPEKD